MSKSILLSSWLLGSWLYFILVLHLHYKLDYFHSQNWLTEWIKTAEQSAREMWIQYYKPMITEITSLPVGSSIVFHLHSHWFLRWILMIPLRMLTTSARTWSKIHSRHISGHLSLIVVILYPIGWWNSTNALPEWKPRQSCLREHWLKWHLTSFPHQVGFWHCLLFLC